MSADGPGPSALRCRSAAVGCPRPSVAGLAGGPSSASPKLCSGDARRSSVKTRISSRIRSGRRALAAVAAAGEVPDRAVCRPINTLPSGPLGTPRKATCCSFIGVLYGCCRSITARANGSMPMDQGLPTVDTAKSRSDEFGIKGERILCYDKPKI